MKIVPKGVCTASKSNYLTNIVLNPGTIELPEISGEILEGVVVRPLRSVNPDQSEYSGLIRTQTDNPDENGPEYEFGIMGLVNKRELLQG